MGLDSRDSVARMGKAGKCKGFFGWIFFILV
jgi:hypothetical protein